MKTVSFFGVLMFCSAAFVSAADYYIDARTGSDSADGLSPQSAWQTLDQVNAFEAAPGDRFLFKRGEIWRGTLNLHSGNESAKIVYSAYGEGEKPRIYGSVPLDLESDWTSEGENLWATRKTELIDLEGDVPFLSGGWSVHTEGGAQVERSIQGEGTGASIRLHCKAAGDQAHHIQLINAPFPIQRGHCYRIRLSASCDKPLESLGVRLSMAGSPWSGYGEIVSKNGNITSEPSEQTYVFKANQTAQDARITLALGGLLPTDSTLTLDSFRVNEVKIDTLGLAVDVGNVILDGQKAAFKRWTKEDLKNQDDFWYDLLGDGRLWFYSKENPAARYQSMEAANMRHIINHSAAHDVTVEGLDIRYGAAHGFGGTGAKRLVIRDCDISWIGGGDQYRGGGPGRRVRYGNGIEFWSSASDCLVENCRIWEVYDAALTNQGAGTNVEERITYRGNLIWNCEYSFEYWNRDETSRTEHILFEKNRCYHAGDGWGHVQRPDKNGRHFMVYQNSARTIDFVVRDNVFCGATESLVRLDRCKSNPDWPNQGLTLDSNRYFDASNRDCAYWLGEKYAFDAFDDFREASGMEKSGVWQQPEETLESLISEKK